MLALLQATEALMDLPSYSVRELNEAIGVLLERAFAPRFLIEAAVLKPVLKKGHLWFSLTDGDATIQAVAWASTLQRLNYCPEDGDGVVVVGKLNFWVARANLSVQVLDIRPSLTTVLRRFEAVKTKLTEEGLLAPERKRALPEFPSCIALLTAVPSSALADLLRTAQQRWPACAIRVVAIPVQGDREDAICAVFEKLEQHWQLLGIEALVLARGGGSREDLALFDSEALARCLSRCPIPTITGIGHEDDITVADLVADQRAATPTAAIVALLPDRTHKAQQLQQLAMQWRLYPQNRMLRLWEVHQQKKLTKQCQSLIERRLEKNHWQLNNLINLRQAVSPQRLLSRGYAILKGTDGKVIRSGEGLKSGDALTAQLSGGQLGLTVKNWLKQP
ncbi:exodeoxyribonuclease VII large subunit [Synechococcus lacustris]|uniref:exodeoxyribonuclease VII large subunit n=1 Tax=Synechococcus lacustris TaxID=2116544 RepID=UPI003340F865